MPRAARGGDSRRAHDCSGYVFGGIGVGLIAVSVLMTWGGVRLFVASRIHAQYLPRLALAPSFGRANGLELVARF